MTLGSWGVLGTWSRLLDSWWVSDLVVVATGLGSSFDLVLNLLLLFFVWVTNFNSLTNLSLLGSVQGVEGLSITALVGRGLNIVGIVVDVWVVHSITGVSLGWAWSRATLCSNPSLTSLTGWIILTIRNGFALSLCHLVLTWNTSLILLLLKDHLLFNLLLMKLLRWRQIEVINDIGNVCYSILLSFCWILENYSFLILETVLYYFPLIIFSRAFVSFLSCTISTRIFIRDWLIFAKITFINLLLVPKVYRGLIYLDILRCQMLTSMVVSCQPWID